MEANTTKILVTLTVEVELRGTSPAVAASNIKSRVTAFTLPLGMEVIKDTATTAFKIMDK